jgi:hypothetical protein
VLFVLLPLGIEQKHLPGQSLPPPVTLTLFLVCHSLYKSKTCMHACTWDFSHHHHHKRLVVVLCYTYWCHDQVLTWCRACHWSTLSPWQLIGSPFGMSIKSICGGGAIFVPLPSLCGAATSRSLCVCLSASSRVVKIVFYFHHFFLKLFS